MARSLIKTKGRKELGSFLMVPHAILGSGAYIGLSAKSVKLLFDMFAQFKGNNNGDLSAAWGVMKPKGWKSRDTLTKALRELEKSELIEKTRQGGRNMCSLYAVTWLSINECNKKLDVRETRVASGKWKNKS